MGCTEIDLTYEAPTSYLPRFGCYSGFVRWYGIIVPYLLTTAKAEEGRTHTTETIQVRGKGAAPYYEVELDSLNFGLQNYLVKPSNQDSVN